MKKALSLLFIALVTLSFAGCKGNSSDSHNHSHSDTEISTQSQQSNNDPSKHDIGGTTEDNLYTNNYLELRFNAPDSWTFFDKAALAGLTSADPDLSTKAAADSLGAAYDMMAIDHTKEASVSLVFENLTVTSGSLLSAKDYADSVIKMGLNQAPESALESEATVTIGENSYVKVIITRTDQNKPLVQTHYLRAVDNYMVHITATVPLSKSTEVDFDSMFR